MQEAIWLRTTIPFCGPGGLIDREFSSAEADQWLDIEGMGPGRQG
jgi:hypothetical protein